MHQKKTKTTIAKKVVSWVLGVPMAIIAISEPKTLSAWWIPAIAIVGLALILAWNGAMREEEEVAPYARRRR